jgi:hypothetical protein
MTCIVAIAQNGSVFMASDHAASDEKSGIIFSRKEPKVFKVGQYGVAFTDSFRMGQILQYNWTPPKYTPTKTNSGLDKFMRTKFIDSVKVAFKDNGYGNFNNSAEDGDTGGIFIVGVEGRIYTIDEDFHVGEHVLPYMAEGSGCMFALGSLHTTKNQKNPKIRLKLALEAASTFSMSVAPPFTYIQI